MKKSAVCGIIVGDEILLLQRMGRIKGWCLPGGKVDPGETFIQGAIRETEEETGIQIGIPKYVGDGQSMDNQYLVKTYYITLDNKPTVTLSPGEHSEYKWVKFSDIHKYELAGNTQDFIDLIVMHF
jgi:8-oxo-dGTP pyrophosphatase MutT (NUDIX family)